MRNLILLVFSILFVSNLFSQETIDYEEITPFGIELINQTRIDLIENRRDTFFVNVSESYFKYNLIEYDTTEKQIIFDEFDNLLTINSLNSLLPKFTHLTFVCGLEFNNGTFENSYTDKNNNWVYLFYKKFDDKKILVSVKIRSDNLFYTHTFF